MAITVNGVTGSVTDTEWAIMHDAMMEGLRKEYVQSGLVVTPSTGRVLSVSLGRSYQAGTTADLTGTAQTVTIAANTASTARIDTVCLQVNWAGTEATAGTLVVVQGVAAQNPVVRGLTKTPGGVWQTPLAYVTVAAGASTISAGSIVDARPGANRVPRFAVRAARAVTRQLIPASSWTPILFDAIHHQVNDFGGTSVNISGSSQGLFVAPVAGTYQLSAQAHFVNQVGTTNTKRQIRAVNRNVAGADRWVKYGTQRDAGSNFDWVEFDGTMDMQAGQTIQFQVWHDENHSVYLADNGGTFPGSMVDGTTAYGSMTLLVAD